MRKLLNAASILVWVGFVACASGPETAPPGSRRTSARHERPQPTRPRETTAIAPKPAGPVLSLAAAMSRYDSTIAGLTRADDRDVATLKELLAKFLPDHPPSLKLLTNQETGSGWYAGVLAGVTPEGRIYFIDKEGNSFSELLKDRVLGGVYTDPANKKGLITLFFSDPSSSVPIHAYWGTQKAEVLQFKVDHEDNAHLAAKVRLPNGRMLTLSRQGRDNKNVQVNGSPLVPLFL